jgi:Rieske Fe-S protein
VIINLDSNPVLSAAGSVAIVRVPGGEFVVIRTALESFTVLTATCTHEGCTVSGMIDQRLVCPCHGSEFDTEGLVLRGPASRPLRRFATTLADNVLTVML